jgi:hypothetical protein
MGDFTQPSAPRTFERTHIRVGVNGAMEVGIAIKNAAGRVIDRFELTLPLSGAVTDNEGNQISANVPGAIGTARTALLTAIDNAIENAAAAGKFNR